MHCIHEEPLYLERNPYGFAVSCLHESRHSLHVYTQRDTLTLHRPHSAAPGHGHSSTAVGCRVSVNISAVRGAWYSHSTPLQADTIVQCTMAMLYVLVRSWPSGVRSPARTALPVPLELQAGPGCTLVSRVSGVGAGPDDVRVVASVAGSGGRARALSLSTLPVRRDAETRKREFRIVNRITNRIRNTRVQ